MTRYRIGLMLLGVVLAVAPVSAAEDNLLTNGDFSQVGEGGTPTGWRIGKGDQVSVDTSEVPQGAKASLRVVVQTASNNYGEISQRLKIKPGQTYKLTGTLKSSKARLAFFQIKLFEDKTELKRITSDKSGGAWKTVELKFDTGKATMVEVMCRYTRGDADKDEKAWFAAVSLVESKPEPAEVIDAKAVATFQSAGVTVNYRGDPTELAACKVRYRLKDAAEWREAMDLVRCAGEHQFRGSLLNLQPASDYEIECQLWDAGFQADKPLAVQTLEVTTWSDEVPVARTVRLPAGTSKEPLVIAEQGTPDGWILYTSAQDGASMIDVSAAASEAREPQAAVRIEGAAYVILENVTIRGGAANAVYLQKSHHVRVRRCDIAGWGDPGTRKEGLPKGLYVDKNDKLINDQAGVHVGPECAQVVVEGNFIHSQRGTANSWQYGHPVGPQGVILHSTAGNNVVRDNEIIGDEKHWWNDCIESMYNPNANGGPFSDTDISGNVLTFSNDDGAELDGGQRNVRFFNNWIQWAYCGLSCAPNILGPSYAFGNLLVMHGDERGRTNFALKMGGDKFANPGVTFLWHNTVISDFAGLSTGHYGSGATPITARNNVYVSGYFRLAGTIAGNYDFDHDLLPAGIFGPDEAGLEAQGLVGAPRFVDADAGDWRLAPGSLGVDGGRKLPGVNDGFSDQAPDMGAFEVGVAGADFPRRAGDMSALPLMARPTCIAGGDDASAMPAQVRLTVPAALGTRWTAHSNADWLSCAPSTGAVDGKMQVIKVSASRTNLDVRTHRSAVTFRTDAGYCRTVLVELRVGHRQPFAVNIEAEAGAVSGEFACVDDATAWGGAYLHRPQAAPSSTAAESQGTVALAFDVPADGVYYVLGRVMAPGPRATTHDSFLTAMDDQPAKRWDMMHAGSPLWHWVLVDTADEHPRRFELTKGRHVLRILSREPQARLDAVRISNEPYPPQ
ncbi:MAG: right-handed parallel beta-helix repeat-containing protein [Phycisphaeraceae bacterium]